MQFKYILIGLQICWEYFPFNLNWFWPVIHNLEVFANYPAFHREHPQLIVREFFVKVDTDLGS